MELRTSNLAAALFRLSDAVAWALLIFSIAVALSAFLLDVIPPNQIATSERFFSAGLCSVVAVGAFLLTRRRIVGLVLVLLAPLAFNYYRNISVVLCYAALSLLVFAAPFIVAARHARKHHVEQAS